MGLRVSALGNTANTSSSSEQHSVSKRNVTEVASRHVTSCR